MLTKPGYVKDTNVITRGDKWEAIIDSFNNPVKETKIQCFR